jgi:hypothetical protein
MIVFRPISWPCESVRSRTTAAPQNMTFRISKARRRVETALSPLGRSHQEKIWKAYCRHEPGKPDDIVEPGHEPYVASLDYPVSGRSVAVLMH